MFNNRHPEWPDFERRVRARLDRHVSELESLVDFDRTNFVRGQIAALREILSDADAPPPGAPPPKY